MLIKWLGFNHQLNGIQKGLFMGLDDSYFLVICYSSLLLKPWRIEIVDLPTKNGDFPVRYVSLPEGNGFSIGFMTLLICFWVVWMGRNLIITWFLNCISQEPDKSQGAYVKGVAERKITIFFRTVNQLFLCAMASIANCNKWPEGNYHQVPWIIPSECHEVDGYILIIWLKNHYNCGIFVGIPSSWNVNILLKSVLESSIPYQPTILDQISPKCWMVKNTENFDKVDSQSTKKQVEHS